ncbi:virulence protein RhuM/Fic/DOC family protein [uncultured Prevotella sp.]|uniref:virulence protein RhuM/Fic/DOC family protein n=1 Tax=uncultured Prevotella sp. TaxID=159272 RepID=UPI002638B04B|nr:virulence protein RhuM/Fic/DOC family protein [uncultured Prevotella sp.]MEE1386625.1 virulence protein RhuM/Fic/DOC family protein [Prevotella sp.]
MNNQIEIYRSQDGSVQLNVKLENETVWLTQSQMAELFGVDRTSIVRHIRNIYKSEELEENSTCAKNAQVRIEGQRQIVREIPYYNLDMIISVGYRINSKNATSFRRWATSVLKQYLIKGYVINQQLKLDRYNELKDVVRLMGRAIGMQEKVTTDEYSGLFNVISDYVYALDTLDHYDYQSLSIQQTTKNEPFRATYDNAMEAINALKDKFGGSQWFANEKDDSFKSSIGQIYQTFGGEELYPSVEEKAAMLLYLVVKNHSFSDGNKRIAAMLFLWFLNNNRVLYAEDGHKRIADNTLVALTLMIAESRTEEKDVMVKVVVNLINKENQ